MFKPLNRREFMAAASLVAACGGKVAPRTPIAGDAVAQPPPLYSATPGVLSDADAASLCDFLREMGSRWEMPTGSAQSFREILWLKTGQAPSYLAEYQSMARLIEHRGGAKEALEHLISAKPGDVDDASVHARAHVLRELGLLLLANGGLAAFGSPLLTDYPYFGSYRAYRKLAA